MAELKQMYDIVNPNQDIMHDEEIRLSDPEKRLYLVCIAFMDDVDEWYILMGRTETYEYIKERIDNIDFETSFVLVETLKLKDRISIYQFMAKVQNNYDDGFDINEHIKGDWNEADFRSSQGIDESLNISNDNRLSMESIMNGEVETTSL